MLRHFAAAGDYYLRRRNFIEDNKSQLHFNNNKKRSASHVINGISSSQGKGPYKVGHIKA